MALDGQDDTDLQKCLARIETPLLVGLACLDGRFDHALAAIHALMTLRHDRPVMLVGAHDVVLRVRGEAHLRPKRMPVSVWPLGRQAFGVSDGLRWQLDERQWLPDCRSAHRTRRRADGAYSSVADRQQRATASRMMTVMPSLSRIAVSGAA